MTESKNKVGRPTVMTQEVIDKLEYVFSIGGSDLEACLHADINKATLYNYQKENPEFVDRKERLKEKMVLKARTVMDNALNDNDRQSAQWYLQRKKKAEFSDRQEVTGADGKEFKGLTVEFVEAKKDAD